MTKEKILEVVNVYREKFEKLMISQVDFSHGEYVDPDDNWNDTLSHCCGMLDRIEKAFRWLGFIQGCLWMSGICTLDDLKNNNRPDTTT